MSFLPSQQRALRCALAILTVLSISACSGRASESSLPDGHLVKSEAFTASLSSGSPCSAQNKFASARGQALSSTTDLDTYIDQSLSAPDRKEAENLMRIMPPLQRGDFVLNRGNGKLMSNNPSLLACVTSRKVAVSQGVEGVGRPSTGLLAGMPRRPLDYTSSCSPPNPGAYPGGAYSRMVSQCGFSAGWGFVNVPCGETAFAQGDVGDLYFEVRGASGSLVEGGLQYNNDSSVQPYLRSTTAGYITLNNSGAHYGCGQNLVVWEGATLNGAYNFTEVGQLPSSYDPQTAWVDEETISLANAAWLFSNSPGDYMGVGTDPAGASTPCVTCSVSRVTSIAQGEPFNYKIDGSFFGVSSLITSGINWMQVAFGNWGSNCQPGTSLCTFFVSVYPQVYYGGPQAYPNGSISQSNQGPTGYGPYESYDSIDETGNSGQSKLRAPAGTFAEPLPPLPCSLDSHGYCDRRESQTATGNCTKKGLDPQIDYRSVFQVYHGRGAESTFTQNDVWSGTACQTETITWYPGDPAKTFSDPLLP